MRVAARLRQQITNGKYAPGDRVPSITDLAGYTGHARQTCAKGLQLLETEGLLTRVPGLGYYVTPSSR